MITTERYGITGEGQPVIERSSYAPARAEHPLAQDLPGQDGKWLLSSVSNDLAHVGAREVTRVEYNQAVSAWADKSARINAQMAADREARQVSAEQVRMAARAELLALGLSSATTELLVGRR